MKKRLFAFLLPLCMLLPAWSGFSVLALDSDASENISLPVTEEPIASENPFQKIHFYFGSEENAFIDDMTELQSATASVQSDYAATAAMNARSGEPSDENVYITVQFASDYLSDKTYLSLKSARDEAKTAEARDMAKTRQNAYSKSYHAAIVEDNLPLLSDIPYTNANAIDYSSFVTLTVPAALLDTAVLAEIAESEEILHISLTDGFEVVSESSTDTNLTNPPKSDWYDVLDCIGAKNIFLNKTYTGDGIKVGIYESPDGGGVYDVNHENFIKDNGDPVNIEIRECDQQSSTTPPSCHGTGVASILALMLPDADFYYACAPNYISITGLMMEGVSWFIEKGCDIVNCSFGIKSSVYRYDYDAVYDYQIEANEILVVAACGNIPRIHTSEVTSPARAYNVISVGGVEYSTSSSNWIYSENACYSGTDGRIKPNVVAPYYIKILDITEVFEGTSGSAPLVTACIAILQEHVITNISSSMLSVERVFSIVMATAGRTADYAAVNSLYECGDDRGGAGIINLTKMLSLANSSIVNDTGSGSTMIYRKSITLSAGDEICIAASWYVEATPVSVGQTGGNVTVSNYNLYLNTSSGTVAASIFTSNNVEYIRYTVPSDVASQTYYVTLVRVGAVSTQTSIGIAYCYH